MYSESGKKDGTLIPSSDTIQVGKNIGKANETTPEEQAILEAKARWIKKKKKNYVEGYNDAVKGKVSELIEGGYDPMLVKTYQKDKKHIIFPCAGQAKADGIRGSFAGQKECMWSRTRKKIISVPHIPAYLYANAKNFKEMDGELYSHEFKDNFEELKHIVGQKKTPTKDHERMGFYVFDIPSDKPFRERLKDLETLRKQIAYTGSPITVAKTKICNNEEELFAFYEECLANGWEGIIIRNLNAPYEYKRSFQIQRLKPNEDAEFEIVGAEEGRGKLTGHAGAFICIVGKHNDSGILAEDLKAFLTNGSQPGDYKFFGAKLKGELSKLKEYFVNIDKYIGKQLTVQFEGYTNKNQVPRFGVGIRVREKE